MSIIEHLSIQWTLIWWFAIWEAKELQDVVDKLWLALAKGKNFSYIAANELVACLGPETLPVFYEFIGCNTLSAFYRTWKENSMGQLEHFP